MRKPCNVSFIDRHLADEPILCEKLEGHSGVHSGYTKDRSKGAIWGIDRPPLKVYNRDYDDGSRDPA